MTDPQHYDEADLQRQWDELENESNRHAQPTPDLNDRRRGTKKPILIGLAGIALVAIAVFFALTVMSPDAPEESELVFAVPEQPSESQAMLSDYVAENRNALNENVAHINSVAEDVNATQRQLSELITSLQNLNPLQMQQNQEEIIVKVRELDSRQRDIEEQVRQSFQFQADTQDINERLTEVIQNHNRLVQEIEQLKDSVQQAHLDLEYLTQSIAQEQPASTSESTPVGEDGVIHALAQCLDESLEKPPGFELQGGDVNVAEQLAARFAQQLENGETTLFHLEEKLAACRNPSAS